ncbi:MAG: hypothetical protein H0U76_29725 [Ktedonobacteraceae bacterium]|nr:hypothetical protein [Ktedonobacteraceae bacterium]
MARKARVEFEGALYHVLVVGMGRKAIFRYDEDRTEGHVGLALILRTVRQGSI